MAYAAMKPTKPGLEEPQEQIHKIRMTLSSKNVKNLEKEFDEEKPQAFPKGEDIKKYRVSSGEEANNFIDRDEEQKVSSVSIDMVSNEAESPDEEDDELSRRVEDFIEKNIRSWRAEKLNAYSLGQN